MFPLPKGKPKFLRSKEAILQKWSILVLMLLSIYLLGGCSRIQNIDSSLQFLSCSQLADNIEDFQKNCQTDSDCIRVDDPRTFCYSETIHSSKKNAYETLFKALNCPIDKEGQNKRGDYCETDRKSNNYCNLGSKMCTVGIKN